MPFYVSWMKDGRARRFAYPHNHLETALGFAREILDMEHSDVWVADESGAKVADRDAILRYAEEADELEEDETEASE